MLESTASIRFRASQDQRGLGFIRAMQYANYPEVSTFASTAAGPNWFEAGEPFLLIDGARIPAIEKWLGRHVPAQDWMSLLGATTGSPLLSASPVLIKVTSRLAGAHVRRVLTKPEYLRAASVLVSHLSLSELAAHLAGHITIEDPDRTRWGLAFWDPFILATLVGSQPALSAIVPGPILSPAQIGSLLGPIAYWCFKGWQGEMRTIGPIPESQTCTLPFKFDQDQMDQLADIPLPETIIRTFREAAPELLAEQNDEELHILCCNAIRTSRANGKNDLSDYCSAAFDALSVLAEHRRVATDTVKQGKST